MIEWISVEDRMPEPTDKGDLLAKFEDSDHRALGIYDVCSYGEITYIEYEGWGHKKKITEVCFYIYDDDYGYCPVYPKHWFKITG